MARQEEPLYDFPEPTQPSQQKGLAHQKGRGSLRSISVLDRLLLTVPVWLQLSINPATALHILRREPPGTFIIRKSRTSQRNVLCVRLADDSVPSFVRQFGIKEEQSSKTLCLETSAISFPDLPRLIAFYCVSRDVLPFPLELPEAIARATSHKELESISHMGIEFWNSHLNVRGPRDAPKSLTDKGDEKKPDAASSAPHDPVPQPVPAPPSNSAAQPSSDNQTGATPDPEASDAKRPGPGHTLFQEFCPITTRSPQELDCGAGLGALCFINPLFLQSQNVLSRQRMLKRSLKIRISTETSSLLSPPLAAPPPPPLVPKTKRKCKARKEAELCEGDPSGAVTSSETQEPARTQTGPDRGEESQLPTGLEPFPCDCDYMTPPPAVNVSHSPSLSPYMSPAASPMPPLLFPKMCPSRSPHDSPSASPSLSPYQSPSLPHRAPFSLSPYDSPNLSPFSSPPSSPVPPLPLTPFATAALFQLTEQADGTYAAPTRPAQGTGVDKDEGEGETKDVQKGGCDEEEDGLAVRMNVVSLNDSESCRAEQHVAPLFSTRPTT